MLGHRGCRLSITYPAICQNAGTSHYRGGAERQKEQARSRTARDHDSARSVRSNGTQAMVKDEIVDEIKQVFKEKKAKMQVHDRHNDRGPAGPH